MSNIASNIPGTQAHKESHSSHNQAHSEEHHSSTTQGIGNKIQQGVEGLKEKLPGTNEHQATHPTSGTHGTHGHHGLAGAGNPTGSQMQGDVPTYGRDQPGFAGTGVGGTSGTVLGAGEPGTAHHGHHGHHGHHTGATGVTGGTNIGHGQNLTGSEGQGVASHIPGTASHGATHGTTGTGMTGNTGTTGTGMTGNTGTTGSNMGGGHNTSNLSTGEKIASMIPGTKTNQAKKDGLL